MIDLRPLDYSYDTLEPCLISEFVKIHYQQHAASAAEKLNRILETRREFDNWNLTELLTHRRLLAVREWQELWICAAVCYNHQVYFDSMTGKGGKEPKGELRVRIERQFGSFDAFVETFTGHAEGLYGNGYSWLAADRSGKLYITNTKDEEILPLYQLRPLLVIDLWEHAYYMQYQGRRDEYVRNWFSVVDWGRAEERYG